MRRYYGLDATRVKGRMPAIVSRNAGILGALSVTYRLPLIAMGR
jgi:hypothetical protein